VRGRVYGALNLVYEPERAHLRVSGLTERESTAGLETALAVQAATGVFVGGEARFLRHYDGLAMNRRDGQALYVGPTFHARLSAAWWASAAWNVQAAGHAANTAGASDLVNFERHQVKFRLGYHF
jgi:hypothetical protein